MKAKNSKQLTKLVDTVFKNIYSNVASQKNSDYEKIFRAFEGYPRRSMDAVISLIVPYVEDVVEEMEGKDKALSFSDTDITYAASTVAEMIGDRLRNRLGESTEDQEFEMGLELKERLKESLMKKAKFLS